MSIFRRNLAKKGKYITLQNRAIQAPVFGSVDFDEDFSTNRTVLALIKTISGRTYFDGVNPERPITHELRIGYLPDITSETWVLFGTRRLDILAFENCCENDEILVLTCNDRGTATASRS